MIDRLSPQRWPVGLTHSAHQGNVPSILLPQNRALPPRSPSEQAGPVGSRDPGPVSPGEGEALQPVPLIVAIDDSITVRTIMETTHRRYGLALHTFADGVEALQWFQHHAAVIPSLIYLDVCLPRMDGYDVARLFHRRPHLAAVPILMLSGRDGVLDRLKGRLAGANGYLTKPFRGEEIVQHTLRYVSTGQQFSRRPWKNEPHAGGNH